ILFAIRDFRLVLHHVHCRNRLQLKLLAATIQRLLCEVERAAFHLLVFIRRHQVPVHIGDLRYRRRNLQLECFIGNLFIISCYAQEAQVWSETEPRQQLLIEKHTVVRVQRGIKQAKRAVTGVAAVDETGVEGGSCWERLSIAEVSVDRVRLQGGHAFKGDVRERLRKVLVVYLASDRGIVRRDICACTKRRLHETRGTRTCTARTARCTAGTSTTRA